MTTPPADSGSTDPWRPPSHAEDSGTERDSDPTAPGYSGEESTPFDPYRFGPPGPNPYGYPEGPPARPAPPFPGASNPPGPFPPPGRPYQYQQQPTYPSVVAPGSTHRYPQPATGNGKAIAALVLGILSIILFFLSIFDVPLFALGIIFGVLGMKAADRGAGGKGMAMAGLICAIIGGLCCLAFTGFFAKRIVDCGNKYDTGTSAYDRCLRNGS